jgi:hypothetical protein
MIGEPFSFPFTPHTSHCCDADDALNDYEEVNEITNGGEARDLNSVSNITAHVTVRTMGLENIPAKWTSMSPLVMTPHCHAPSCIRQEMWNIDTNPPTLLCRAFARYGNSSTELYNEANCKLIATEQQLALIAGLLLYFPLL